MTQAGKPASQPLSRPAAYAMLAALVVIWGLNWPIMKLVVHAMPPLWFVVTRLTVGAACLFAFLLVTGRLATPTRADWPVVISVSLFQMWLFIGLTTIGLQFIPAGRSVDIVSEMDGAGVLFGDGIETDRIEFSWGRKVSLHAAPTRLRLLCG